MRSVGAPNCSLLLKRRLGEGRDPRGSEAEGLRLCRRSAGAVGLSRRAAIPYLEVPQTVHVIIWYINMVQEYTACSIL